MKGTVTPLSDTISVSDAANVARKVAEAVEAQRQQLQTLETFSEENQALCKLLLELPDLVSYNVMVPFGKAAFMPGRLIHTNEFLVLLGEGYYAERSAKQAAEILARRSELMDSKFEAIKAHINDLEAEASFVKDTAAEAAAGVVEIREDYFDPPVQSVLEMIENYDNSEVQPEANMYDDAEHTRIMARIAELEVAEAAAEEADEDALKASEAVFDSQEDEESDEDEETTLRAAFRRSLLESSSDEEDIEEEVEDERTRRNTALNSSASPSIEDTVSQFRRNLVESGDDSPARAREQIPNGVLEREQRLVPSSDTQVSAQSSRASATQRAFSGAVMERNVEDLPPPAVVPASEAPPSRPVSKFKMRKG